MSNAAGDFIIRLAIASMAADKDSAMTPGQRLWTIGRLQSTTPLSYEEMMQLKTSLLAWSHTRWKPETTEILDAQFAQEENENDHLP